MKRSTVRWTTALTFVATLTLALTSLAQTTQPAKPVAAPATQPAKPAAAPAKPAARPVVVVEPGPAIDPVFETIPNAPGATWAVTGNAYKIELDPALKLPVLTADNKALTFDTAAPVTGSRVVTAWIRLRPSATGNVDANVTLHLNYQDAKNQGYMLRIIGSSKAETANTSVTLNGKPLAGPTPEQIRAQGWAPDRGAPGRFLYQVRAYTQFLPGWPEEYREQIEHDMATLPPLANKWMPIRVESSASLLNFWLDDHLVATIENPNPTPEGKLRISLTGGAQLAAVRVAEAEKTAPGFLPVGLSGYLNASALLGGKAVDPNSLPPANKPHTISGVPFVFPGTHPDGNDHIDVGRSFLREANTMGYVKSNGPRLSGSDHRDPARIQIRIPFKHYDRLYFIAGVGDRADAVPVLSAIFYKPDVGFSQFVSATVTTKTTAIPVKLTGGADANLYLVEVPIDPAILTGFSDLDIFEVELTKQVLPWRSYPDPISYGYHQAGPPSSVQVYAMTLGVAPVSFEFTPDQFGHVWKHDQTAGYSVKLANHTAAPVTGKCMLTTRSYDGSETTKVELPVKLAAGAEDTLKFALPLKLFGYHDVVATLDLDGKLTTKSWTEKRSLTRLAPDTRSTRWTQGKGAMFGYWSYNGGHYTPDVNHVVRVMTWAGARNTMHPVKPAALQPETAEMISKHWGLAQAGAWEVSPQPWLAEENPDKERIAKFQADVIEKIKKYRATVDPQFLPDQVYFYPEPHVSSRLSAGNIPDYWGEAPYELTDDEKKRIKMFVNTSRYAAEAVRRDLPGVKVYIPWGDPGFIWILLRNGLPPELVDGVGIDTPGFERIPERQLHEQSIHRLYTLKKELERANVKNPVLQFCEGIFVPTEPGAVSWREQMDIYNRWALLSMAYGVDRFYSGWFAFDCGSYYGAEHYGGCGIQRRIPFCDPKPGYAAYATMTDKLNEANFDGWLPTGSLTTYALAFKHETRGQIATLWTLRGKRPVTLTLNADAKVIVTDTMNNSREVASANKQLTLVTDQSVSYITFTDAKTKVVAVAVGEPDHSDSAPATDSKLVGDLGDGSWSLAPRKDEVLENNHWAIMHYPGKFTSKIEKDVKLGDVLTTTLPPQEKVHELMPWYTILKPAKPIAIAGAPSHVGLWAKGNSDWGRVIYVLRDAKGERWTSIGAKDDYNCDDSHSWSQFCFDGWRYLRFEMPGHAGYDSFRKIGTNWWRGDAGDDIVDLPLALEEIIVEQRSHILYVNDVQKVAGDSVSFGKLLMEYETPADATEQAVVTSKLRMPRPTGTPELPNPIAQLTKEGVGEPTKLTKLTAPEHYYDGTRMHVAYEEVPNAAKYYLYVGAYPDGRGAVNMTANGLKQGQLVNGMRPKIKLYFWIVYEDKDKKLSKPSPVHAEVLVDNFKEK